MHASQRPLLFLPVETTARELDAKLLLGLFAGGEGFDVIIGNRQLLNRQIQRFPCGLYLMHNFNRKRRRIARILAQLGHRLAAWDEEGLVWLNAETYARRRVDRQAVAPIAAIFAWGEEHAEALQAAGVPRSKIHITGNPRIDLLRAPLRAIYEPKAQQLRARFGPFILINSSFGWLNYKLAPKHLKGEARLHEIARKSGHALETLRFKQQLFEAFKELIPVLARTFPERTIIIRPHPSEDESAWQDVASAHGNVQVVRDSDLIPWLMACEAMIHNGCTTAVEHAALGKAPISFQPFTDPQNDMPQPMQVSQPASSVEEVIALLKGEAQLQDRKAAMNRMIANLDGPLAAQRIAALLRPWQLAPAPARLRGRVAAGWRSLEAMVRAKLPWTPANPAYVAQKFPPLPLPELEERAQNLCMLIEMPMPHIQQIADRIFRLSWPQQAPQALS